MVVRHFVAAITGNDIQVMMSLLDCAKFAVSKSMATKLSIYFQNSHCVVYAAKVQKKSDMCKFIARRFIDLTKINRKILIFRSR